MNMLRTIRGGSWNSDARGCRSAYHSRRDPDSRSRLLDFRLINRRELRVVRGGSWLSFARACRSASRGRVGPGLRYGSLGFRLINRP